MQLSRFTIPSPPVLNVGKKLGRAPRSVRRFQIHHTLRMAFADGD
jgi:hypothetical protein